MGSSLNTSLSIYRIIEQKLTAETCTTSAASRRNWLAVDFEHRSSPWSAIDWSILGEKRRRQRRKKTRRKKKAEKRRQPVNPFRPWKSHRPQAHSPLDV